MGVPIALGYREDGASGAQIVDGGLRFNRSTYQRLERTPSAGNTRTWTWSGWVKRHAISSSNRYMLFCADGASNNNTIEFNGDSLDVYNYSGGYVWRLLSTSLYRDVSAWYHVVVAVDTTISSPSSDRVKIYVNGVRVTNFSTETYPSQNATGKINSVVGHNISGLTGAGSDSTYYYDGSMSNVYLIDGQALGPGYFGYTDRLTNTWRPKKFKPTATPNNGTTWSNYWSGSILGGYPATDAFDGNLATSTRTGGGTLTWTAPSSIPFTTLRLYAGRDGSPTGEIYVNGTNVSSQFGSGADWVTVTGVSSPLTSIALKEISGQYPRLSAVEVNGVILLDGDTTNMGKNGFYLPLDGSAPIGQDQSGRGNNWTPVNLSGFTALDKATGALPILNTTSGGKVSDCWCKD